MTLRYKVCLSVVKRFEDHDIKLDRAELLSLLVSICLFDLYLAIISDLGRWEGKLFHFILVLVKVLVFVIFLPHYII